MLECRVCAKKRDCKFCGKTFKYVRKTKFYCSRSCVSKDWYRNNRELSRQRAKDWRENNREKADAAYKEWVKKNPDKRDACQKRYREKNKEKIKKLQRDWYLKNREVKLLGERIKRRQRKIANAKM